MDNVTKYRTIIPVITQAFGLATDSILNDGANGDIYGAQSPEVRNLLEAAKAVAAKLGTVPTEPKDEEAKEWAVNIAEELKAITKAAAVFDAYLSPASRGDAVRADSETLEQFLARMTGTG